MNGFLTQVLLVVLIVLASACLLLWSAAGIRYHVTDRHLKVTWLGLPVRWLRLSDIRHISNRPVFWAERWPNTLFDSRRMLVIHRRHSLFRHFVITPKYPYEFKASLERARHTPVASPNGSDVSAEAPPPTPSKAITSPHFPSRPTRKPPFPS